MRRQCKYTISNGKALPVWGRSKLSFPEKVKKFSSFNYINLTDKTRIYLSLLYLPSPMSFSPCVSHLVHVLCIRVTESVRLKLYLKERNTHGELYCQGNSNISKAVTILKQHTWRYAVLNHPFDVVLINYSPKLISKSRRLSALRHAIISLRRTLCSIRSIHFSWVSCTLQKYKDNILYS